MENILGKPAELDAEAVCCADDIAITMVSTFHDDEKGAKRGNNIVFIFEVDGLKVVHMGDIGCMDDNVVNKIKNCDVLMIPVGGVYTIDASLAKQYVDTVNPKIVLPMHYMTQNHKFKLGSLNEFLSLFNQEQIERRNCESLTIYDIPQNVTPKIVILDKFTD